MEVGGELRDSLRGDSCIEDCDCAACREGMLVDDGASEEWSLPFGALPEGFACCSNVESLLIVEVGTDGTIGWRARNVRAATWSPFHSDISIIISAECVRNGFGIIGEFNANK